MNRRSMFFSKQQQRQNRGYAKAQLSMEALEPLNMLTPLYPDMFAWESESDGYLHDYIVEGDLLRFTTALANDGQGNLEVFGGQVLPNGNQEVWQRVYHDDGSHEDHLAGEFTYHPGHGHIHFDGYAIYSLREVTPEGGVGEIVATGGKISFCLIDIAEYNPDAGPSNYHSCGQTQGVTAGWTDVYTRGLANQWIDITGIPDGEYWLEVVVDPESQLLESDETNNVTRIIVDITDGPGDQGDRYEPNNSFGTAANMGVVAKRQEAAISIHTDQDEDFYQFTAVEDGSFEITASFSHDLGNLDAFLYDSNENLIVSGTSNDDLEILSFEVMAGETFYLHIDGVDGATNGYELDFDGPGDIVTVTVPSTDTPVTIPDGTGSSQPGSAAISTIEGADITLTDLNLIFDDLDHTWLGDLEFQLTSPQGTQVTVIHSQWDGGGLLGSEDDFTNTFLDDQAPANLEDGVAPFSGNFNVQHTSVPANPLAAFNGESALGTWTLEIVDWHNADTGTLNAWSLMFSGIDNNPGDELEKNDAFPQATWLGQLGTAQIDNLSIHIPEDQDFFRFQAKAVGITEIDITFAHAAGNLDFFVYDNTLSEIARSDSTTDNESLKIPVQQDDLYYIQVVGYTGDTNSNYSLTVDAPTVPFETGALRNVNHAWQTVNFNREFIDPVVVLSLPTMQDGEPVTTRIQNVTGSGFELQLMEWNYLNGTHANEEIGYFVVESGQHLMEDGTILEAGIQESVGRAFAKAVFHTPFEFIPVVVAQIEAHHDTALTPRIAGANSSGFAVRVQEQESADPTSPTPLGNIHYVAILEGAGDLNGKQYEVGRIDNSNTGTTSFEVPFESNPLIFGSIQSFKDSDPVNVRLMSSASDQFGYLFQEDQSWDKEITHGGEQLAYFALAGNSWGRSGVANSGTDQLRPQSNTPDLTNPRGNGDWRFAEEPLLSNRLDRGITAVLPWFQVPAMPDDCFLDGRHETAETVNNPTMMDAGLSQAQTSKQTLDSAIEQAFPETEILGGEKITDRNLMVTKRR